MQKSNLMIDNICKNFGHFCALDGVTTHIPSAKLTTLLGPSGCGKTTLLRIIAGLEQPDVGRIHFLGNDITDIPIQNRHMGFVFQNYALFRHKSVFDNVAFGLKMQKKDKSYINDRVDELLTLVQLTHTKQRYPHELSGGQRQRIALVRALATNPKLLLLDEPFGALDARVRKELGAHLKSIVQSLGITTIMVTHDQDEAVAISDHIIVMNDGKIAATGAPSLLFGEQNDFVVDFFGL